MAVSRGTAVTRAGGIVAERVAVSTLLDPYFSLRALAAYSGIGKRTLEKYLTDSLNPLPCYRLPGGRKVLVRRSEFDQWISQFRAAGAPMALKQTVVDVLARLDKNRAAS
jgi:excisionase family DNA binding protein